MTRLLILLTSSLTFALALLASSAHAVDFARDVRPILERSCASCHAGGKRKGGFRIDTRETLLAGGRGGAAVVVGKSGESLLVRLISTDDEDEAMPAEGERLTAAEIDVLRLWIDGGLAWPEGFSFASRAKKRSIAPRTPELPEVSAAGMEHPIDRLLAPYFEKHAIAPPEPVADGIWARRVYLDLIGLPPMPDELRDFVADGSSKKRERLVDALLARRRDHADHWLTFWNDALRNAYRGTGFIDGGRKQITGWLYRALFENKPYDVFVRELLSPVPDAGGSEGFVKGIVWRGVVNASQMKEMQAAQNVGQVFLGTNIKCASCHDSFVNDWTLEDAYALASVFAEKPLEMHRCNKPTGEHVPPRAPFAELGAIDADASRDERMKQLAIFVTSPRNGRLSRTIVNRLWERFMGRGIVEPVDEMENEPWHADLLDWLASDLVAHGWDLKHTMRRIVTSRAYGLPAVGALGPDETEYVFRGPLVRRMSAEQFIDALVRLTGIELPALDALTKVDGRGQGGQLAAVRSAVGSEERPLRAALANADPLMRALGRPNREQVVTRRESIATTLQALELTNGETLAGMLERGASRRLELAESPGALVDDVFLLALGRAPSADERDLARTVLGDAPTREAVSDLLWIVIMLPEFQLIH